MPTKGVEYVEPAPVPYATGFAVVTRPGLFSEVPRSGWWHRLKERAIERRAKLGSKGIPAEVIDLKEVDS